MPKTIVRIVRGATTAPVNDDPKAVTIEHSDGERVIGFEFTPPLTPAKKGRKTEDWLWKAYIAREVPDPLTPAQQLTAAAERLAAR
jgi:hypothetical protein